jgi:HAD superfamily phosphoserine phosphatase-like hydrolase
MKKIAIFDLDFTLINMNSTYEFIKYFFYTSRSSLKKRFFVMMYFILDAVGFPWQYFLKKRTWFIALLKDVPEDDLKKAARSFIQARVRQTLNHEVFSRFQSLRSEGYYCVILSSSLGFVVEAFAEAFSFDGHIASTVAMSANGICLGHLAHDLTGIKEESLSRLEDRLGPIDFDQSYFFTDNQEDIGLAKKIGNSFGVVSEAIRKKYWLGNGLGALQVIPALRINPDLFFVPGMYYFYFRTTVKNFIFYHFGFLVLIVALLKQHCSPGDFLLLLVSLLGYISIYEIGYFLNDYQAVTKEKHPSLRIDAQVCERLKIGFFAYRLIFFAAALSLLSFFFTASSIGYYFIANLVTLAVFVVHNYMKQKSRLLTYSILKLSHFVVPVLVFDVDMTVPLTTLILVYLPIALMRYYKKGYIVDSGRLMYFAKAYAGLVIVYFSALCIAFKMGYPPASFYMVFFFYIMFANVVYYQGHLPKLGLRFKRVFS